MMGSKSKEKGASGAFLADRVGSISDTGNVPLSNPADAMYEMLMTGQMVSNSLIYELLQNDPALIGHVDDVFSDFNDVFSNNRFSQTRATNFVTRLRRFGVTPTICDIINRQYANYFAGSKLSISDLCDKLRKGDSCDFNEYAPILVTLSDERIYGDFCTIYYNQDMYAALKFMDNLRENNRINKSAKIAYALYFKNLFSKNPDAFIDQIQQYFVEKSQEYRQPHMGNDLFTGKERTSYADSVVFTSNMVKNCICEFFDESVVLKSKLGETWQHLSNLCLVGRNEKEIKWYTKQLQGELKTTFKKFLRVFASKDKDKIKEMLLREKINLYALIHFSSSLNALSDLLKDVKEEKINEVLKTLESFISSVDNLNKSPEDTKVIMNLLIDEFMEELNREDAGAVFKILLEFIDKGFYNLIDKNFHDSELFETSSAASPDIQGVVRGINADLSIVHKFMSERNPERLQYSAYALYLAQRDVAEVAKDNTVRSAFRIICHNEICSKMQWTPIGQPTNAIKLKQNIASKNTYENTYPYRVVIKLNSKFIVVEKFYGNTLFLDLETGKFLSAADLNAYSEGAKDIQIGRYDPEAKKSQDLSALARPIEGTEDDIRSALLNVATLTRKSLRSPALAHLS